MTLEEKLKVYQEKIKQKPLTSAIIITALLLVLLIAVPYFDISHRGINNATVEATLENQDRATLAQIFGGVAIGIGLYYTWRRIGIAEEDLKATQENLKVTQENLKVSQEGQLTERFTRAVEQLGSDKLEIRLGGIYALERIASESDRDYWPIMEILTAYIRKNSWNDIYKYRQKTIADYRKNLDERFPNKISLDIQAILTVIKRRKFSYGIGEFEGLNLEGTYLQKANLVAANLKKANLAEATLPGANLRFANLIGANLTKANLIGAKLEDADFSLANLPGATLTNANLLNANFYKADLRETPTLSFDQLSKVKTLYGTLLDDDFRIALKKEYPSLFEKPKD